MLLLDTSMELLNSVFSPIAVRRMFRVATWGDARCRAPLDERDRCVGLRWKDDSMLWTRTGDPAAIGWELDTDCRREQSLAQERSMLLFAGRPRDTGVVNPLKLRWLPSFMGDCCWCCDCCCCCCCCCCCWSCCPSCTNGKRKLEFISLLLVFVVGLRLRSSAPLKKRRRWCDILKSKDACLRDWPL